jgi:glycosyltransferase involved in cell wall biosynthesis
MPYQESVSIGIAGHDTARWMSPMKMFEYMASGAAIVSSDLPVLREVLVAEHNCLLAPAADVARWSECVARLAADAQLRERLGGNAHEDYARSHTWTIRAKSLLAAGALL